ncbi:MAG: hypothetical protein AABZ39_05595 [Spirochaetota bacterium]
MNRSVFYPLCNPCIAAVLLFSLVVGAAAQGTKTDDTGQKICIYAKRDIGAAKLRQGFVHGVTYEKGRDYSRTIELVTALKPASWRLANFDNNVYGFVVDEAKLPQTLGTAIVFNIQDVFNEHYGWDVRISPFCGPKKKNCFKSYDQFKRSWLGVVNGIVKGRAEKNFIIDYYDVFAEPNYGQGKLDMPVEQFYDTFKITHDALRQYQTNVKIVAPSFLGYGIKILSRFLVYVASNDLRLDALAWHEFDTPEVIPAHVDEIRAFFKTNPKLCNPAPPEIHINEYAPEGQYLIPGYCVGYLYYLEKAGVDHANRACWGLGNDCWNGFEGMFLNDNITTRPIYWVYKAYAEMNRIRILTESAVPQTIAIASRDDARKEIRVLAGRYGQKGRSGPLTIDINDIPYGAASVNVLISRIPDRGLQPQPAPPSPKAHVVAVMNGTVSVVIPDPRDGEAYSIVIR